MHLLSFPSQSSRIAERTQERIRRGHPGRAGTARADEKEEVQVPVIPDGGSCCSCCRRYCFFLFFFSLLFFEDSRVRANAATRTEKRGKHAFEETKKYTYTHTFNVG